MKSVFFSLLFALFTLAALAQKAVPPHNGIWVHDEAGILSPQTIQQLEHILKAHRDTTSTQIAVYIVASLEGDDIDDYAVRVFQEWKLGQEKKDNGVLFLVAMQERQMRIEVGYGLEGELTDAVSSRINRNEVAPYFRQGDYDSGIKAGVLAIIKVVAGTYTNDAPVAKKRKGRSPIGSILFFIILLVIMSRRSRGGGAAGLIGSYWSAAMLGSMMGGGYGRSSGSWDSRDFGGGGFSGGGGSSDSW
jgi:uncharacterized protein